MFNVDTLTLGMNLEDRLKSYISLKDKTTKAIDYEYIKKIDEKLKSKLYLDSKNRAKLQMMKSCTDKLYNIYSKYNRDCIYWYGKDEGYSFCYNETRHVLTITLLHYNVEQYTAEEILNNVKNKLITYFDIDQTDILPLTLRRIDYHCDYKYRDESELLAIKSIIGKATDTVYTYTKETTDTADTYLVKYLSLKKDFTDSVIDIYTKTIIDKESDFDEV